MEIGNFEILGIKGIQAKNANLEKSVTEATKLASSEFPNKVSQLNTSMKKLKEEKTNYEDMVAVSSSDDVQAASQLAKYKIDFLWTKIGTHATSEGVVIKMDITNGSGAADTYNLNFTVNGGYINIAEFIRDIEDDSKLGFKIEEFSTFVCKDVPIEGISQTTQATPKVEETNTNNATNTGNTTNGNTTNTSANTNTTTNSTNTANTTK